MEVGRCVKEGEEFLKKIPSLRGKGDIELFSAWQTRKYEPPKCENGNVPRDRFGSVPLYLQWMLPVGTTHLRQPGLVRLCSKLKIDQAPAMMGWKRLQKFMVPNYCGIVVPTDRVEELLSVRKKEKERSEIERDLRDSREIR